MCYVRPSYNKFNMFCILSLQLLPLSTYFESISFLLTFPPQSTKSAGPVRFLIFCSKSIFLLASLLAGRRPQCTLAGNLLYHTYPLEYQISSSYPRQKCWASSLRIYLLGFPRPCRCYVCVMRETGLGPENTLNIYPAWCQRIPSFIACSLLEEFPAAALQVSLNLL
jgi:hypothetical protein